MLSPVFFWGGGVQTMASWRSPLTRKHLRNLSESRIRAVIDATIVPQGDVVVDMTRSEDKLMLIPGNAVGTATPVGIPVCYWRTRKIEG